MKTQVNPFEEHVNILLVEDNPADAELISIILKKEIKNLRFARVDTAKDLRKSLDEFGPQIIISDYSIPGFSGLEALSICRTLTPDTPFIFVSGTIGEERAVDALKQGAVDYVLKDSLTRLPHAIQTTLSMLRDNRQKQRQQDELARTYELLNSVFDTTHMLVAYMDTSFNFIQVNRSFAQKCGSEPMNFIGKNFFSVFENANMKDVFHDTVRTGKPHFSFTWAFQAKTRTGHQSFIADWSLAVTNTYGVVEGLVFTAADVTERMQKEQEIIQTRQRFHDALNQAPDAIIITNAKKEIAFFSQEAEKYFGYSYEEVLGKTIEILIPSRFEQLYGKFQEEYAIKPERRAMDVLENLTAKRKDGSEFPVDFNLGPLSWEGETGAMVVLRDITLRKAQEEELKKLSLVASKIDNGVYIGDADLYPLWVNESFTRLTGFTLEDIRDRAPIEIFEPGAHERQDIEEMISALLMGNPAHGEIRLKKDDGSTYWVSIYATPVKDENGEIENIIAIISDISLRKEADEEILKQRELLKDAEHIAKLGSWEWNIEKDEVRWSDEMYNQFEIEKKITKNASFQLGFELVHPDDRERVIENAKTHKQLPHTSIQYRIITPSGEEKYLESNTRHVTNDKGELLSVVGTSHDVTHVVKEEEEKRKIHAQAMAMLEEKVVERTERLTEAYEQIQTKNRDLSDSINYAKHIQNAFIPSLSIEQIGVADFFIIDMPRDVLSGDFHWCHRDFVNNCTYKVLGDCTGHGVPGALMTILAVQLLEQHISEKKKKREPKQVVMELDAAITDLLGQTNEKSMLNDGMEMVLFRIDHAEQTIHFTNIGRDVYHYRLGKMQKYKGYKSMVGGAIRVQTQGAEEHEIKLQPGDRIYTFSDGYADQFGGEENKKMLRMRQEAFLNKIQSEPFNNHRQLLQDHFIKWKGDNFQVDDMIALGLEL